MARRSTFDADAESVQGNAGATVTFRAITVDEFKEYRETSMTDREMIASHVIAWKGIEDDNGHDMPSPADEPGIVGKLYLQELQALARLLFAGPPAIPIPN